MFPIRWYDSKSAMMNDDSISYTTFIQFMAKKIFNDYNNFHPLSPILRTCHQIWNNSSIKKWIFLQTLSYFFPLIKFLVSICSPQKYYNKSRKFHNVEHFPRDCHFVSWILLIYWTKKPCWDENTIHLENYSRELSRKIVKVFEVPVNCVSRTMKFSAQCEIKTETNIHPLYLRQSVHLSGLSLSSF